MKQCSELWLTRGWRRLARLACLNGADSALQCSFIPILLCNCEMALLGKFWICRMMQNWLLCISIGSRLAVTRAISFRQNTMKPARNTTCTGTSLARYTRQCCFVEVIVAWSTIEALWTVDHAYDWWDSSYSASISFYRVMWALAVLCRVKESRRNA